MTELFPVTNKPAFLNASLEKATQMIMAIDANIKSKQFDIASILATVDTDKLYSDDGFTSAVEYANTTFGIQKTLAYNLITIGKEYTRAIRSDKGKITGHCSNLTTPAHPDKQDAPLIDFTVGQISRFITLGREKVVELINSGDLHPRLTIKEINEIVKANKPPKQLDTQKQPTQKQPTQEQPTQEQPTQEQPTQEQQEQPTPDRYVEKLDIERIPVWDNTPSNYLIAELRLRGYIVYNRDNTEMVIDWGEQSSIE